MSEPFVGEIRVASRLVNKLAGAGLEADEAALLGAVFQRAADASDAVEGFDAERLSLVGTYPSRGFKGSDEELQVLVDWLLEFKVDPPTR